MCNLDCIICAHRWWLIKTYPCVCLFECEIVNQTFDSLMLFSLCFSFLFFYIKNDKWSSELEPYYLYYIFVKWWLGDHHLTFLFMKVIMFYLMLHELVWFEEINCKKKKTIILWHSCTIFLSSWIWGLIFIWFWIALWYELLKNTLKQKYLS